MFLGTELFSGITVAHVIYAAIVLMVALVVSFVARLVSNRVKTRLRAKERAVLAAQFVDDMDGPVSTLLLLTGIYLVLIGLPPVADHEMVIRRGFTVVAISLVVFTALRIQAHALSWYMGRLGRSSGQVKVLNTMLPMAKRVVAILIVVMGALVIMDQLGIAIAPLVAGLGIAGLAVALALQGTLTNFFAGINILTDGSVRVGDYVELEGGLAGYIDQIGWRTTRIRMLANNMIIIPNSKLADSVATNYHFPVEEMSVYVNVGVAYSSDLDHVEEVTLEVANEVMKETEGSVEGYAPSIWYTDFGDSNINFWAVLRANGYVDMWLLKHNFIKALFRRYNEEGIEISFPARSLYFKNSVPLTDEPQATSRQTGDRRSSGRVARGTSLHQDMGSSQGDGGGGGEPDHPPG